MKTMDFKNVLTCGSSKSIISLLSWRNEPVIPKNKLYDIAMRDLLFFFSEWISEIIIICILRLINLPIQFFFLNKKLYSIECLIFNGIRHKTQKQIKTSDLNRLYDYRYYIACIFIQTHSAIKNNKITKFNLDNVYENLFLLPLNSIPNILIA